MSGATGGGGSEERGFRWVHPEGAGSLLVEVPHAGLAIPEPEASQMDLRPEELWPATDLFVDHIVKDMAERGASLLMARISRLVVDLNRAADDVSRLVVPDHPAPRPRRSRGVVWGRALDGRPILRRPLRYAEFQARLDRYYVPYHATLRRALERHRSAGGHVLVLAIHSMLPEGPDGVRADIVPGTLGRRSAAGPLIDALEAHFREAGFSVRHDAPYRGGFTTEHYGRPERGVHVVQVEINRGLYADWRSGRPDEAAIEALARIFADLVAPMRDALEALPPRRG